MSRWSLDGLNLSENLSWLIERRAMVLKILQGCEELQGLGARLCALTATDTQLVALVETLDQMDQAKRAVTSKSSPKPIPVFII